MTDQHGYSLYRAGCRCDTCKNANMRRVKEYRLNGSKTIDPEKVRNHIAMLIEAGMSHNHIARIAAVSVSTIQRIHYQRPNARRTLKSTAAKILAITPTPSPTKPTDAEPARRRIKALMCMGWTQPQIQEHSKVSIAVINAIVAGRRHDINVQSDQRIRHTYEQLSMTHGPSTRTRRYAMRKHWIPPLGWDDIDDPQEKPRWHETVHTSVIQKDRSERRSKTSTQPPPSSYPTLGTSGSGGTTHANPAA